MLFLALGHSQKLETSFHTVVVEMSHFVELRLDSSNELDTYSINEKQSGEYSDAVIFKSFIANDTLFFEDAMSPVFELPQDKLSAHKITDSKANIKIPKNKSVLISMAHTNAEISGDYQLLRVNVSNGSVWLNSVSGNSEITTINANVIGSQLGNYEVTASSRNGKVSASSKKNHPAYTMTVESVNGNIEIQ
ncbi:hypothetical protein AAU57_00925 [Nonlabens sp. YIK11]|nr:hypothetical protein AAU57_00925 [Nonlabens sp. YIK11]